MTISDSGSSYYMKNKFYYINHWTNNRTHSTRNRHYDNSLYQWCSIGSVNITKKMFLIILSRIEIEWEIVKNHSNIHW